MGVLDWFRPGATVAETVEATGSALDKLFTSDAERLDAAALRERLRQAPAALQAEITRTEAGHRSVWVAGWRPAVGWVCAAGLFSHFVAAPWGAAFGLTFPPIDFAPLMTLVLSLSGMGALRSVEKIKGVAR